MTGYRIKQHPILAIPEPEIIEFFWQDEPLTAHEGETIAAALIANGIHIFGHHHKDGSPLGIFCANGQCSQCMVIADGKPLKSCMELVTRGMRVYPNDGHPHLPEVNKEFKKNDAVAVIESVKSASDVFCPVSGQIVAVNDNLRENPELVSKDPLGEGWIFKIKITDFNEVSKLMNYEGFKKFINKKS